MRIERTAKTVIAGLMSVACLASVAACGPGSSSNKANTETEAVSTDLGDTKYELKLWDGAGLKTFDDQLIEAFQKKYPNITIKATYDPDNTSQQNGPRIISAADTPDIARITDINSAVRGNHVVNLDAYADAYGWKLPDSQTQVYRVGSDGKIGSGSLYAVPDGVSMTGLYWNKKVAKELGITEDPEQRFSFAVLDYAIRGLYAEISNISQLRDEIAGGTSRDPVKRVRRSKGQIRRRAPRSPG